MKKWYLSIYFFVILLLIIVKVQAKIVRIEITSTEPAFEGKIFGNVGAYEKLKGEAYGEIDSKLPQNVVITNLQLVPRNGHGMVEFAMDIYILIPINLNKGNHKLFAELSNRGGKIFVGFNKSAEVMIHLQHNRLLKAF